MLMQKNIIFNEYNELKSEYTILKTKQIIENNEINNEELKNLSRKINKFKQQIYKYKDLSKEELKRYNFDDTQIEAIQTYDGSEAKTAKTASTFKFSVKKNKMTYNSKTGLSTVKATVTFTKNGSFEEYGNDAFAMAYEADNNHNFKTISTKSSSLKYKEYKSTDNVKTWSKTATNKGDQGVTGSYGWSFTFKTMGDKYYAYLTSGTFSTTGVISGKVKYFNVRYLYSHRTMPINTSFGISISKSGASASITLSPKTGFSAYPSKNGGIYTCS